MTSDNLYALDHYLRRLPNVQLLTSILLPGVSDTIIAKQEAQLGYPIEDDIKAFFKTHNGVLLRWIDRNEARFDAVRHVENSVLSDESWTATDQFFDYDPLDPTGKIFIPPFETLFTTFNYHSNFNSPEDPFLFNICMEEYLSDIARWSGPDWPLKFDGAAYASADDLYKHIRIFDYHQRDGAIMLHLKPNNPNPPVIYAETLAINEHCNTMPLGLYLKLLPFTLGDPMTKWRLFSDPKQWLANNIKPDMPFPNPF